jgi:precorrin-3B C17-methyltransferase
MAGEALNALRESSLIAGYPLYLSLLAPEFDTKEKIYTGMTAEAERCRMALSEADRGRTVALVCSGDAGVYGMAAPVLELAPEYPEADVQIIPGVTAALSGAAVLGAPLGHDFCVISLSDLLTPWDVIEKRLRSAAEGDFAICLYNPASKKREDYLRRACDIVLGRRSGDTLCGWVKNIGRTGQEHRLLTLSELREEKLDMFTTVFIGASTTREIAGRMVTPRGYRLT